MAKRKPTHAGSRPAKIHKRTVTDKLGLGENPPPPAPPAKVHEVKIGGNQSATDGSSTPHVAPDRSRDGRALLHIGDEMHSLMHTLDSYLSDVEPLPPKPDHALFETDRPTAQRMADALAEALRKRGKYLNQYAVRAGDLLLEAYCAGAFEGDGEFETIVQDRYGIVPEDNRASHIFRSVVQDWMPNRDNRYGGERYAYPGMDCERPDTWLLAKGYVQVIGKLADMLHANVTPLMLPTYEARYGELLKQTQPPIHPLSIAAVDRLRDVTLACLDTACSFFTYMARFNESVVSANPEQFKANAIASALELHGVLRATEKAGVYELESNIERANAAHLEAQRIGRVEASTAHLVTLAYANEMAQSFRFYHSSIQALEHSGPGRYRRSPQTEHDALRRYNRSLADSIARLTAADQPKLNARIRIEAARLSATLESQSLRHSEMDVAPCAAGSDGQVMAETHEPRCLVTLFGRDKKLQLNGTEKPKVNPARYDVVKALVDAGPDGLTKDELDKCSGHTDARKLLNRLAYPHGKGARKGKPDCEWCSVISFPEKSGDRYRLIHV